MQSNDLVADLLNHNEDAYKQLISQYYRLIWAVVGGVLKDAAGCSIEDIEECVADVFIDFWKRPEKYNPNKGALGSYLCILAKSKALNIRKKNGRQNVFYLEDYNDLIFNKESLEQQDYKALYAAINLLHEPTKEIMVRRYFHGQKPQQIADIMHLPKKKVENCLYNGKKAIVKSLTGMEKVSDGTI